MRYGNLSWYVYAEDSENLAYECKNRYSENYNDGDTEYDYSNLRVNSTTMKKLRIKHSIFTIQFMNLTLKKWSYLQKIETKAPT